MPVHMVVIGPPGAGKGTQAMMLADILGIAHVSTGELFRKNISDGSELGMQVETILSSGRLVSDELTISLVRDRLQHTSCQRGAVLDGFPRTPEQAEALDDILDKDGNRVDLVPYIRVRDETIIDRLTSRRVDVNTGNIYHVRYNPPPLGVEVEQRADDIPETVQTRIAEYYKNTAPLIEYYTSKGVLQEFDGEQTVEAVSEQLLAAVEEKVA